MSILIFMHFAAKIHDTDGATVSFQSLEIDQSKINVSSTGASIPDRRRGKQECYLRAILNWVWLFPK